MNTPPTLKVRHQTEQSSLFDWLSIDHFTPFITGCSAHHPQNTLQLLNVTILTASSSHEQLDMCHECWLCKWWPSFVFFHNSLLLNARFLLKLHPSFYLPLLTLIRSLNYFITKSLTNYYQQQLFHQHDALPSIMCFRESPLSVSALQ